MEVFVERTKNLGEEQKHHFKKIFSVRSSVSALILHKLKSTAKDDHKHKIVFIIYNIVWCDSVVNYVNFQKGETGSSFENQCWKLTIQMSAASTLVVLT